MATKKTPTKKAPAKKAVVKKVPEKKTKSVPIFETVESIKEDKPVVKEKKLLDRIPAKVKRYLIIGAIVIAAGLIAWYIFRPAKIKSSGNEALREYFNNRIDSIRKEEVRRHTEDSIRTEERLNALSEDKKKVEYKIIEREKKTNDFILNASDAEKQRYIDSVFPK